MRHLGAAEPVGNAVAEQLEHRPRHGSEVCGRVMWKRVLKADRLRRGYEHLAGSRSRTDQAPVIDEYRGRSLLIRNLWVWRHRRAERTFERVRQRILSRCGDAVDMKDVGEEVAGDGR